MPKLDKVPVVYRSERAQLKQNSPHRSNPELGVIDEWLASGALNPPTESAAKPHPLIRETASLLRSRSRKDEHGKLLLREAGGLNVQVTEGTLDRALRVMSRVLSVLEKQNLSVEISEQGSTVALIEGQPISFGIEEPIRKVVTQKPRVPNPTDRWDYDQTVTYEPSGMLALMIHSASWQTAGLRTKWSDAKIQRIENMIPNFVAELMRIAVVLRQKAEEEKRRELAEQKKARELEKLRKEEKKLKEFDHWLENWERAEQMRRFIALYAENSKSWPAEQQPKYREWID